MNNLRTRVYNRVKAKSLNGRFINGVMLAELCEAYTEAINQGSLPNIDSAWNYLC